MTPSPAKYTLRLGEPYHEKLVQIQISTGLNYRALFEALVLNCRRLGDRHTGGELTEAELNTIKAVWEVARRISQKMRDDGPQDRVSIRFDVDRDLLAYAQDLCKRRGVSLNSFLAAAVVPWGSGWGGPAEYKVREEWWEFIVSTGRNLMYQRRRLQGGGR